MSPSRRTPYRPPRPRRELYTAIAVGLSVVLFTALMVWVLGPHASSTPSTPAISIPPSTVPKPARSAPSTTTRPTAAASTTTTTHR